MTAKHTTKGPTEEQVASTLGAAREVWDEIIDTIGHKYQPLEQEWKVSKAEFGWICLLKHKKRTLLYLTPEKGKVTIAIVLGERAAAIALKSGLPAKIKTMIAEARPYAEGRGIRFQVSSCREVPTVTDLVDIKTTPK